MGDSRQLQRLPRVVATDLDGTLLRSDGSVGERSRRTLAAVEEAGSLLVFVTGRPPRHMAPVADATGHRGVAICANGALLYDLAAERVVRTDPFDRDDVAAVVRALRAEIPELAFGVEWATGFAHEPAYRRGTRESELLPGAVTADQTDELFAEPVVKLLARHVDLPVGELAGRARAALDGTATVTHSSVGLLEISAVGVTKASALERLAADHGATAGDVIAFGDMPNDLPMLTWAGYAVAVADAHPDVRNAVDEVTSSNDDEGVAAVLERLLDTDAAPAAKPDAG